MDNLSLVDALPYIDQSYEDDKGTILSMIQDETQRYKPTKNYISFLGEECLHKFETQLMKNEFNRIEKEIPMEKLNLTRYSLPFPSLARQKDVISWQKSLNNSFSQLEFQNFNLLNLKLMLDYGVEANKESNDKIEKLVQNKKKVFNNIEREYQEKNYLRKTVQEKTGEKLKHLEANWVSLVSKNFEIEQECLKLDNEIKVSKEFFKFTPVDQNESQEPNPKRLKV